MKLWKKCRNQRRSHDLWKFSFILKFKPLKNCFRHSSHVISFSWHNWQWQFGQRSPDHKIPFLVRQLQNWVTLRIWEECRNRSRDLKSYNYDLSDLRTWPQKMDFFTLKFQYQPNQVRRHSYAISFSWHNFWQWKFEPRSRDRNILFISLTTARLEILKISHVTTSRDVLKFG